MSEMKRRKILFIFRYSDSKSALVSKYLEFSQTRPIKTSLKVDANMTLAYFTGTSSIILPKQALEGGVNYVRKNYKKD